MISLSFVCKKMVMMPKRFKRHFSPNVRFPQHFRCGPRPGPPEARLQRLTESLNRIVHDAGHHADLVATMALVEIDLASHRVYYTNMGHSPAILLSKNKAHMVHAMGSPLGLYENIVIKVKEYQAEPSEILLFYADGWLENCKPGEKPLFFKRFLSCLEPCGSLDDLSQALQTIHEQRRITAIAIQFQAAQAKLMNFPSVKIQRFFKKGCLEQ